MPYDRTWAVAHEKSKAKPGEWAPCTNFTRAAGLPQLQAISACLDEATEVLTLSHPDLSDLTFHPDRDLNAFLAWVAPLCPETRAQPTQILRLDERGFTDSHVPSISLMSQASHEAVEQAANSSLDIARWRGNIWIEGLAPWAEKAWIGRKIQLGDVVLHCDDALTRCKSIHANPETGVRDIDLLSVLERFGHQTFGISLSVLEGGDINVGDTVELI